jgi:ABC-type transport system substrate-binding protein
VLSTAGAGSEHFEIRVAPPGDTALENKLVRRALAYGIDRKALVQALYGDIAPKLRPLDNTIYLTNDPEYRPNWSMYRHRPALARRLLGQAGCRLGPDRIYVCAGAERLSLRFVTTAGSPERARTLRIVQTQLRRIGVEVVPVYASGATLFGPILTSGAFDVALFSWLKSAPGQVESGYRCGNDSNATGYCSRVVTSDLNQSDQIVDPERQAVVANRADRQLAQDVPVIPLFQSPSFVAFRDTIHGIVPDAFIDPTWNAGNWWVER